MGHFPPPIHGNSVATERFADLLSQHAATVHLDISGEGHEHNVAFYGRRITRTVRAVAHILRRGRKCDALYLGCDDGPGMLLMILISLAAMTKGMRRFVHHHSRAYIDRKSRLMTVLVHLRAARTTHIFPCERQALAFQAAYPVARSWMVLPITYVLEDMATGLQMAHTRRSLNAGVLTLGHLSNLTAEKGLFRVFDTLEAARALDLQVELKLAGPVLQDADAARLTTELLEAAPHAQYLGPLSGGEKEAFFASIDVFLFPSTYRSEFSPIVTAEAMLAGVPLIAYRAGCLEASSVGEAGIILSQDEDFAARAVEQVQLWIADPDSYRRASEAASSQALAQTRAAVSVAHRLAETITDHGLR